MSSYLNLEGKHALVSGSAGGIGRELVRELLNAGCRVTALDSKQHALDVYGKDVSAKTVHLVQADISSEESITSAMSSAAAHFGPINILCANAGISDELNSIPIWEMSAAHWDRINLVNYRGTFLTVKHFVLAAKQWQDENGRELENMAIVVTGSECGKFGQEGHVDYASGKAGLQYGLVPTVKNEIVRINSKARINAVAPGWVDTPLIHGRLIDPQALWSEGQATVALRKIAVPSDVACAVAFLASHRAAGHISGQTISIDGGMEGRLLWQENASAQAQ